MSKTLNFVFNLLLIGSIFLASTSITKAMSNNQSNEQQECNVCYEDYDNNAMVRLHLSNNDQAEHTMCVDCAHSWLIQNLNNTCPFCRRGVSVSAFSRITTILDQRREQRLLEQQQINNFFSGFNNYLDEEAQENRRRQQEQERLQRERQRREQELLRRQQEEQRQRTQEIMRECNRRQQRENELRRQQNEQVRRLSELRQQREEQRRIERMQNNLNATSCCECFGNGNYINMLHCGHRLCLDCANTRFSSNINMNCPRGNRYSSNNRECITNFSSEELVQIRQNIIDTHEREQREQELERRERRERNLGAVSCCECYSDGYYINMPNCGHRLCFNCANRNFVFNNNINCPRGYGNSADEACRTNFSSEELAQFQQNILNQQNDLIEQEELNRKNRNKFIFGTAITIGIVSLGKYLYTKWQNNKKKTKNKRKKKTTKSSAFK